MDGAAFRLKWSPVRLDESPDATDLPPADYALYLFHLVKFRLGPYSRVFHEPTFLQNLELLEKDLVTVTTSQRLWFAQYLLVLAFGQAFLANSPAESGPQGCGFAERAMALIYDVDQLHEAEILAIEVLALAALYFQSIDMRVAAFHHVGIIIYLV